ncbi:MAG TPA: DUF86 domain-containing protein [bacterium]|nr:DUF86 domain-containing protein [bacterium]HPP29550.1 DUF86 domain-containing protein [bacterium]
MRDKEPIIFEKIERLREELKYLKDNKEKFIKGLYRSTDIKKIVERSVYLCCEIVLDISDLLIVKKGFSKPLTYSEIIYKLGENKIVPEDFAHKFVYIAGLRNFLSHDYTKNTVGELEKFLRTGIKDVEKFLELIKGK